MTQTAREPQIQPTPKTELEVPRNATRTSDYEIRDEVWSAYLASLDRADDLTIVLEMRARGEMREAVELEEFIREQGYDPADLKT